MVYATSDVYDAEILELASSKVDELTFNRIVAIGFDNLTDFQKDKIQKATLKQAEYYDDYGIDAEALSGFSLAGVSMSLQTGSYPGVSKMTISLLKQTGLMIRQVI